MIRTPAHQRQAEQGVRCFRCAHKSRKTTLPLSQREHDGLETRHSRTPPVSPTTAPPGSTAKVQIMIERYAGGYHIHHPDDLSYKHDNKTQAMTSAMNDEDLQATWRQLMNGKIQIFTENGEEVDLD